VSEEIAIIVHGEHSSWALLVEQVLDIEDVEQVYSSGTDGKGLWYVTQDGQIRELMDANQLIDSHSIAPRLWYVTKEGKIQELIDANQLLGMPHETLTINIIEPQKTTKALHLTERLITDGLRISCGVSMYLLPLSMAKRTMKYLDTSSMTKARFPNGQRDNRSGRIPWINATALLFGRHSEIKDSSTVAVMLDNDEQILLNVEAVSLSQSVSAHEKWQAVDLPYPLTLFFDAACYDNETERWILRVVEHIKFRNLPWFIKKSIAKAILGWFDRRR
jgi:chemotaxis signal transduction protein